MADSTTGAPHSSGDSNEASNGRSASFEARVAFLALALALLLAFAAVVASQSGRTKALQLTIAFSLLFLLAIGSAVGRAQSQGWVRGFLRVLVVAGVIGAPLFGFVVLTGTVGAGATGGDQTSSVPIVEAIGIVLGIILLVTGIRKVELAGYWKIALGVADILLLAVSVFLLGWLGFSLALVTNLVALTISSLRIAIKRQSILTYASIQSGATYEQMRNLADDLKRRKAMASLGPIRTAELISALAQRRRDLDEIREMAIPIAMLYVVHEPELNELAGKFDQILRLYNKPATAAMDVADKISVATKTSAATFTETLDGLIAAASP